MDEENDKNPVEGLAEIRSMISGVASLSQQAGLAPKQTVQLLIVEGALLLLSQRGFSADHCENFTTGSCRDEDSGRTLDSPFGGEQWCAACVATEGLKSMAVFWEGGR